MTSAVLPGHISEHTGRPSPSITRQGHLPKVRPVIDPSEPCCRSVCLPAPSKNRLVSMNTRSRRVKQIWAVIEQSLLDRCAANWFRR